LRTNFVSDRSAAWFAELYRRDGLAGGHVIMLGPGNETEARAALAAFPGRLQIGGPSMHKRARLARHRRVAVIVTSWFFAKAAWIGNGSANWSKLSAKTGSCSDLSCRKKL